MPEKVIRCAAWLLLVQTLVGSSGCTVIGYGAGRLHDQNSPDLDTLTVAEAAKRPAETPVAVLRRDGDLVRGRLQTVLVRDPLEAHRTLAGSLPGNVRMPLPGETLLVVTARASGSMVFERLALAGKSYREEGRPARAQRQRPVALFSMGTGAEPLAFPLESVERIEWSDGSAMKGPDLAHAVSSADPPDPQVVVLVDAAGRVDSIAAGTIRGVEAPRIKNAAGQGALIGIALDVLVLWFVVHVMSAMGRALA